MKVVFYGGRQALRLALTYVREAADPQGASWIGNHLSPSPDDMEKLRDADRIVWIDGAAPAPDVLTLELAEKLVRLPELQLDFLWPFGGQPHIANVPDDIYPEGPFPAELGDAWLNRALEGPRRSEAIEEDYLALDVARVIDLDRMRDFNLARQADLDALHGVDFAPRIAAGLREPSLFFSPRTPGPKLFAALAQVAFARLGLTYSGAVEPVPAARELPIHPSVAKHFGLDWALGRVWVEHWGAPVDFTEYVRRYLAFAEGPELEHGLSLLGSLRAEAAAARLETAAARPIGRRSSSARRGLFRASVLVLQEKEQEKGRAADLGAFARADIDDPDVLAALTAFAQGRFALAERRFLTYLARAPDRAENFAMLASIREARGDGDGAFAALELAVGLRPDDGELLARLTKALAARGDVVGAVRSAEAEIARDPQNPHPQAFLAQLQAQAGWPARAEETRDGAPERGVDTPELADASAASTE